MAQQHAQEDQNGDDSVDREGGDKRRPDESSAREDTFAEDKDQTR